MRARLPEGYCFFSLTRVAEASKSSRTNFFILILACSLSILGTLGISEFQVVTNQGLPVLPFLTKSLVVNFFVCYAHFSSFLFRLLPPLSSDAMANPLISYPLFSQMGDSPTETPNPGFSKSWPAIMSSIDGSS